MNVVLGAWCIVDVVPGAGAWCLMDVVPGAGHGALRSFVLVPEALWTWSLVLVQVPCIGAWCLEEPGAGAWCLRDVVPGAGASPGAFMWCWCRVMVHVTGASTLCWCTVPYGHGAWC